jgi:triacylglycerol lipase
LNRGSVEPSWLLEEMRTTWDDLTKPGLASNFFRPEPLVSFKAGKAEYDDVNAWWLMELSRLIYCRRNRKPYLPAGIHEIRFFGHERKKAFGEADTQGVIVGNAERTWAAVVFRGTETPSDWHTALACRLIANRSGGHVHSGFNDALESVWEREIVPELDNLPNSCAVYYGGHSLGAALATLAAARRTPVATYVYGCPLVGDAQFANAFDVAHLYRVVNQEDIVTRVPVSIPYFAPYKHLGQLHTIGNRRSKPSDAGALMLLLESRNLPYPPDPLADHASINYVNLLAGPAGLPPRSGT